MAEKEYIEREAIEKAFAEEIHTNYLDDYAKGFQAALLAVMSIPTADVAPVRHKAWANEETAVTCTACGRSYDTDFEIKRNITLSFDFCPSCGAKMDGEDNG